MLLGLHLYPGCKVLHHGSEPLHRTRRSHSSKIGAPCALLGRMDAENNKKAIWLSHDEISRHHSSSSARKIFLRSPSNVSSGASRLSNTYSTPFFNVIMTSFSSSFCETEVMSLSLRKIRLHLM